MVERNDTDTAMTRWNWIPLYEKPGGHHPVAKLVGYGLIALYAWSVYTDSQEIMAMPLGEILVMYGIPTVMALFTVVMFVFDVTPNKPDNTDDGGDATDRL